jgi:hypothetical protein
MTRNSIFLIIGWVIFLTACASESEKIRGNAESRMNGFDKILYMEGRNFNSREKSIDESIWDKKGLSQFLETEFEDKIMILHEDIDINISGTEYLDLLSEYYIEMIDSIIIANNYKHIILIGTNELGIILPKIYSRLSNKNNISRIAILFRPNELAQLGLEINDIKENKKYFDELNKYESIPGLFIQYSELENAREIFMQGAHAPVKRIYYNDSAVGSETIVEMVGAIKKWIRE